MFRNTEKKLYEKELQSLKGQNKDLLARCERAEKYMHEYEALSKQMKATISKYEALFKKLKETERQLDAYRAALNKSK